MKRRPQNNPWAKHTFNPPDKIGEAADRCLWCSAQLRHTPTCDQVPVSTCCASDQVEHRTYHLEPDERTWRVERTEQKPFCLACNQWSGLVTEQRNKRNRYESPGPYGNGYFCTQLCAAAFGVEQARHGQRLVKPTEKKAS